MDKVNKDKLIALEYTHGKTQQEIANELNIGQATVSRKLNKAETKAYIEQVQAEFLSKALQTSADNIVSVIEGYKDSSSSDPISWQKREHGFRASSKVLESVGIFSGHAQSAYIISIFNSQTNIISPVIQQLLSNLTHTNPDQAQPIDAEFYD